MHSSRRKRDRVDAGSGTSLRARNRARPQNSQQPDQGDTSTMVAPKTEESSIPTEKQQQRSAASTPVPEGAQSNQGQIFEPMDIDETNDLGTEKQPTATARDGSIGTRQERLKAILLQRRSLLNRIQRCRTTAEVRLGKNANKPRQKRPLPSGEGAVEPVPPTGSDNTSQQVITDAKEVDAFRDILRLANQVSRKQRATSDAAQEKRTSVSLRRGSGVGKRMNAALSSLAPGGHGMAASTALESVPHFDGSRAIEMNPLAQPSAAVGALSGQHLNIKQSSLSARILAPPDVKAVVGPAIDKSEFARQSNQKASDSWLGSRTSSLSAFQPRETRASPPPRNELIVPLSKVDFPEAQSLRERRSVVRAKLSSLLQERKRPVDETGASGSRQAVHSSSTYDWRPIPSMPAKIPNRRKTHWDYLLEEMRWLAADFVEERKWKESSARTLASAVVTDSLNALSPTATMKDGRKRRLKKPEFSAPANGKSAHLDEAEADTDAVEASSPNKPLDYGFREYSHPEQSDLKVVRTSASLISSLLSETWDVTVEAGVFAKSDKPHRIARSRFRAIEESFSREASPVHADREMKPEDEANDATPELRSESTPLKSPSQGETGARIALKTGDTIAEHSKRILRISESIEQATARIANRKTKRGRAKSFDESVPLTEPERKAIEFVEFVWSGDSSTGAILDGVAGSGKTLVTCSLLWRNRHFGAQLLICSPARLMRWNHEFSRFPNTKVWILGLQCGITSPLREDKAVTTYGPGDIVICEFSFLFHGWDETEGSTMDFSQFYSVTLDSRHPLETIASDGTSWHEKVTSNVSRIPSERLVPVQLLSRSWWASIFTMLRRVTARRMFVENRGYLRNFATSGITCDVMTERQHIEFIAAKSAFVLGPDNFLDSRSTTVQHKVVSWAKHCVKKTNEDTEKSRFEKVLEHLLDAMSPFVHSIGSQDPTGHTSSAKTWEIRRCSLSSTQRLAYDACCHGLRGALSPGSIGEDNAPSLILSEQCSLAAKALTRLRKLCFHSELGRFMSKAPFGHLANETVHGIPFERRVVNSVSQPDEDLAIEIMESSAKLRELVCVLRDLGTFEPKNPAFLEVLLHSTGQKRKEPPMPSTQLRAENSTKIAVLAVMPQAQIMTSFLLNAIGVPHELLLREVRNVGREHPMTLPSAQQARKNVERLAWIESQMALSAFNAGSTMVPDIAERGAVVPAGVARCDVLVTSPMTVGSDYGGLGVESARVVICIDDEWSGRGEYLMDRIAHRCNVSWDRLFEARKGRIGRNKSSDCHLLRLVCEDTCEERFLSKLDDSSLSLNEATEETLQWRSNIFGCLTLMEDDHNDELDIQNMSGLVADLDGFLPGQSILRHREQALSSVLGISETMQPYLSSGRRMTFLPFVPIGTSASSSRSDAMASSLVRALLECENQMCCFDSNGLPVAVSSALFYANILPPLPEEFPDYAIARHDLSTISLRFLVEMLGSYFGSSHGMASSPLAHGSEAVRPVVKHHVVSSDSADLVDAWHKSGLSCKPDGVVCSLLTYNSPQSSTNDSCLGATGDEVEHRDTSVVLRLVRGEQKARFSSISRLNAFAESFVRCRDGRSSMVRDGNQGAEPYVYFPPRFPGIVRATKRARIDLRHLAEPKLTESPELNSGRSVDTSEARKRTATDLMTTYEGISKRPRLEVQPGSTVGFDSRGHKETQQMPSPPGPSASASHDPDRSSAPVTLHGDLRSLGASGMKEDNALRADSGSGLTFVEDFGLLGIGVLASPEIAVREASLLEVDSLPYSGWNDPFGPVSLCDSYDFTASVACDTDEADGSTCPDFSENKLNSILLFVTKRMHAPTTIGIGGNPLVSSSYSSGIAGLPWTQPAPAVSLSNPLTTSYSSTHTNGDTSAVVSKKGKKRGRDFASETFALGQLARGSSAHRVAAKLQAEVARQKTISMMLGRQGHLGASLFHSPHFRLASVRIRNRVLLRALQAALASSNALGSGPGYPLPSEKGTDWSTETSRRRRWVNGASRIDSFAGNTGAGAHSKSLAEHSARRKTSASPRRVDFGPFQVGFLSSPSGMAGAHRPRPRIGASLPMGVKITPRQGNGKALPWTSAEDEVLSTWAIRFGPHWQLIARAVNASHASESFMGGHARRDRRAARQCRERWEELVEKDPVLADRASKPQHVPDPSSFGGSLAARFALQDKAHAEKVHPSVLVSSTFVRKQERVAGQQEEHAMMHSDNDGISSDIPVSQSRRSFELVKQAALKRQEFPLAIPVAKSGDQRPTLVPSHPSHAQTIQAIATSEMWPLQLLDAIEKKHASDRSSHSSRSYRPSALQAPQQLQRHPSSSQRNSAERRS